MIKANAFVSEVRHVGMVLEPLEFSLLSEYINHKPLPTKESLVVINSVIISKNNIFCVEQLDLNFVV